MLASGCNEHATIDRIQYGAVASGLGATCFSRVPFFAGCPTPRWGPAAPSHPPREQSLARLGAEVVGVDPSPENVAVASAHARGDPLTRSVRYEAATAEELEARGEA